MMCCRSDDRNSLSPTGRGAWNGAAVDAWIIRLPYILTCPGLILRRFRTTLGPCRGPGKHCVSIASIEHVRACTGPALSGLDAAPAQGECAVTEDISAQARSAIAVLGFSRIFARQNLELAALQSHGAPAADLVTPAFRGGGIADAFSRAIRPLGPTTKGNETAFQLPSSSGCQVWPWSRLISEPLAPTAIHALNWALHATPER